MKKFFKLLGILLCIVLAVLYVCFLFVLPNKIDITQYKEEIQKIVKEQTNLDLSYSNERIITTPLLEVGFVADDIKVTLPDKSQIVTADRIKGLVSLPHILLLTARVSKVDIENPIVNAEILKNDPGAFRKKESQAKLHRTKMKTNQISVMDSTLISKKTKHYLG